MTTMNVVMESLPNFDFRGSILEFSAAAEHRESRLPASS